MEKKKLAKNAAIAVSMIGLSVAAPALLPVLALASKDYFGEIFSSLFTDEDVKDSWGKITMGAVTGFLTDLGASFAERVPEALSQEHNFHLETALATAYVESLDSLTLTIKERGNSELLEQSVSIIPLLRSRVKRALKEKNPASLFPAQVSLRIQPSAHAYSNHLSTEALILSLADAERMRAMIAEDTEITLRRWVNEERAHQRESLGIGRDIPLPNPLRSYLREELLLELPRRLGEIVKRNDFSKSWIAFQRAHLQATLITVKNLEGSHQTIIKKLEGLVRLEESVERIADKLGDFLSNARLPQAALDELLKEYSIALEGSLHQKIIQSADRVIFEGNASGQRLHECIEDWKKEILTALHTVRTSGSINHLHQLPPPSRDFTGREEELKELLEQARNGVTISGLQGMGGIGKTALALKLADMLKTDYPDAQFYLDLKGVSQRDGTGIRQEPLKPADVMWHVVNSYNPESQRPSKVEELRAWYYSALEGRRALLLLDNAKDKTQIEPLIPPASCFLLVTSRQHFTLSGMYDLNLEEMSSEDAEGLLLKIVPRLGAQAGRLATQCGNLPLALELAAKALKVNRSLAPEDLIEKLKDRQQRLGLIEASFSLSYDMLGEEQQQRWRQLAVFPDSFSEHHAVGLWLVEEERAKDLLAEFDRLSMLEWNAETERFRLHDLARDFADSRLDESERYDTQHKCAHFFHDILKIVNDMYKEGHENISQALSVFDRELKNIKFGQVWVASNANRDECAAQLCIDYARDGLAILPLRLHPRERLLWFDKALTLARRLQDKRAECVLLQNLGNAYLDMGDAQSAIKYYKQALRVARETVNRYSEGALLGNLGTAYSLLNKYQRSAEYLEQALLIAREVGDRTGEGIWLGSLGNIYKGAAERQQAMQHYEQALSIARELGDRQNESIWLRNIGIIYAELSQHRQSAEYFEQALAIACELGDNFSKDACLRHLGEVYYGLGEHRRAIDYFNQAIVIARECADRRGEAALLGYLGNTYKALAEYQPAIEYYEQALAIAREIGDRHIEGASLGNLGILYSESGEHQQSVGYLEQALIISRKIGDRYNENVQVRSLAEALISLGEYRRAIECLEKALVIARKEKKRGSELEQVSALGACYANLGEHSRAIKYYKQTLTIARELGIRLAEGATLGTLGVTYMKLGDLSNAEESLENALKILEEIKSPHAITFQQRLIELRGQK